MPDSSGEPAPNAAQYQTKLRDWRRSAEGVTHAWNAWLAAERPELSVCYQAWVLALAEEERAAAELERIADTRGSVTPNPR
jgi:phenolic acid decarboxylase